MIEDKVLKLAEDLKRTWAPYLKPSPLLALDESWPSVGVLDHLTFILRRQKELSPVGEQVVRGTSAYLAKMAHECWAAMGAEVTVSDTPGGIVLRATAGPSIADNEEVVFNLEAELRALLLAAPNRLPLFKDFERIVSPHDNHLSSFALSVFVGLHPNAEGPWRELTPDDFSLSIEKAVRLLAQSSADRYTRLYPDEPLGQVAELYLRDLIFPPISYQEDLPCRKAIKGILAFVREYKVPRIKIQELAYNLAFSADERISGVGFALYAATLSAMPSPEFVALAHGKGTFVGLLRTAMYDARVQLGMSGDWLEAAEFNEQHIQRIGIEQRLGFIPWLRMRKEKITSCEHDPALRDLIRDLSRFNFAAAKEAAGNLADETPGEIELRIQQIYLDVIEGNINGAEEHAKRLLSEPESESEPIVYNMLGMIQLVRGDPESAEQSFRRARALPAHDSYLATDIDNNYAWSLMSGGKLDEGLDALELALQRNPQHIVLLLNKASLLFDLNQHEQAEKVHQQTVRLAPLDRRVFAALTYEGFFPQT